MSPPHGIFISCEGGEGVGKSSFLKELAKEIQKSGREVLLTREPGGSPVGETLRPLFNFPPVDDPLTPEGEFLLISASRAQHVAQKIRPALAKGAWILCDRFFDSSLVYQGTLRGIPRPTLDQIISFSTGGLVPHLTFLLDCDVDLALARIKKRSEEPTDQTRFDKAAKIHHEKIRRAYLELAKEFAQRYIIIDASSPLTQIVAGALHSLEKFLKR